MSCGKQINFNLPKMSTWSYQSSLHVHWNFKEYHCKNIHSSWRYTPNIHLRKNLLSVLCSISDTIPITSILAFGFCFVLLIGLFFSAFRLKSTLPLLKRIAPFQSALSMTILHTKMVLSLHNEIFCWCPETHLQERVYSDLGFYTKIIMFIFSLPHSCCWLQAQDETQRLVLKYRP